MAKKVSKNANLLYKIPENVHFWSHWYSKCDGLTKVEVGLLLVSKWLLLPNLLLASVWAVPLDVGNILLRHGMACGKDNQDYGEDGLNKNMCNYIVQKIKKSMYLLTNFMVAFLKVMLRLI